MSEVIRTRELFKPEYEYGEVYTPIDFAMEEKIRPVIAEWCDRFDDFCQEDCAHCLRTNFAKSEPLFTRHKYFLTHRKEVTPDGRKIEVRSLLQIHPSLRSGNVAYSILVDEYGNISGERHNFERVKGRPSVQRTPSRPLTDENLEMLFRIFD